MKIMDCPRLAAGHSRVPSRRFDEPMATNGDDAPRGRRGGSRPRRVPSTLRASSSRALIASTESGMRAGRV